MNEAIITTTIINKIGIIIIKIIIKMKLFRMKKLILERKINEYLIVMQLNSRM